MTYNFHGHLVCYEFAVNLDLSYRRETSSSGGGSLCENMSF